jgi:c-di-GMP-binding flagellar brake protein YcgR
MLEQDDDEKYRIYSEAGILSILRSMMRNNSLVTCYLGHSDSHILTTIIDVDAEQGEMVLDYGVDEAANQRALKADKLNVIAFPDHVKIQFVCEGIEKIQFDGRAAFLTRIPETLLRIQRREFYRVDTPRTVPIKCVISLPKGSTPATVEVILDDISCGGMAVIDTQSRVNFETGAIYRDCLVALPEIGTAKINLQVQHIAEIPHGNGQHARCIYVDPQENVLSMIQRYINKLELELKRKQ